MPASLLHGGSMVPQHFPITGYALCLVPMSRNIDFLTVSTLMQQRAWIYRKTDWLGDTLCYEILVWQCMPWPGP
jgi:hypothetical protein